MPESCRLCQGEPFDDLSEDVDIPLCERHWGGWVMRYFLSEAIPPSNAHLITEVRNG